ncbi:10342_t:CDS:2 [Funneliformis geosporum]|nr:10342_t:CDS:2 [Funneliformis geosporum]
MTPDIPLQTTCSNCKKTFELKWNKGTKKISFKNNLDYWTEQEVHRDRVREKYDTYSGLDTKKVKEYKKLLIKEIREYIDFRLKEDQEEEKNV